MDVFEVRERLVRDYRSFTVAFVEPRDPEIRAFIDRQLAAGTQWPDPWLSLNPSFASGGTVTELVDEGLLDRECERIFRSKNHPDDPGRGPITFHRHQRDAIEVTRSGRSYVLTTGTGSGKSLAYLVPIVDRVLREQNGNSSIWPVSMSSSMALRTVAWLPPTPLMMSASTKVPVWAST